MRAFALSVILGIGLASQAISQEALKIGGTFPLRVAGSVIDLPIEMRAEAVDDDLKVSADAPLSQVVPLAQAELVRALSALPSDCQNRLSHLGTSLQPRQGHLSVSITMRYERWECGKILGAELKTKIARETATIHADLAPTVAEGRLQLRMTAFRVSDLSDFARAFGLDRRLRDAVQSEIAKLNSNPEYTTLPAPMAAEGFAYDNVALQLRDGQPWLSAAIKGPNNGLSVLKILAYLGGLNS